MAGFPYSPNPANVKRFLNHAQTAGVPEKVTQKYLETVGFKSKNDRYVIPVLKFIGFLDQSGVPTKEWQAYRNKAKAAGTLARAIRRSYADLFNTFPDANRKDTEALRNYFSAHTKVAESTLGRIVSTFKTLVDLADFDAKVSDAIEKPETVKKPPSEPPPPSSGSGGPAVNVNIQLQLPATEDGKIYDQLFAALKKHLFS